MAGQNIWTLALITEAGPAIGTYPVPFGEGAGAPLARFDLAQQEPNCVAAFLWKDGEMIGKYVKHPHNLKL